MEDNCTSARVTAHTLKHICSVPLVHHPKGVLLVISYRRAKWRSSNASIPHPYEISFQGQCFAWFRGFPFDAKRDASRSLTPPAWSVVHGCLTICMGFFQALPGRCMVSRKRITGGSRSTVALRYGCHTQCDLTSYEDPHYLPTHSYYMGIAWLTK